MRGYIGNTDFGWYDFLRRRPDLDEVNFWFPKPGGLLRAASLDVATPFFFKLKAAHRHRIAGYGFLVLARELPAAYAWDVFGIKNGAPDSEAFYARIGQYRRELPRSDVRGATIGCLLITQPVFFPPDALVEGPEDWGQNTVRGRYQDLTQGVGARVWRDCLARTAQVQPTLLAEPTAAPLFPGGPRHGAEQVVRPRLGQGSFRVAVTEAYDRRCAITGEHALPVVEAAHIRPYADGGDHLVTNGIALRADLHRLFDRGYIGFDDDRRILVSRRLDRDFQNGKAYYAMEREGRQLVTVEPRWAADLSALAWHRARVFLD